GKSAIVGGGQAPSVLLPPPSLAPSLSLSTPVRGDKPFDAANVEPRYGVKMDMDQSYLLGIEKRLGHFQKCNSIARSMTTLAEHIIVAGAENRPPMLEKSMYDSCASRIPLFIKGKKHGRMMLDSIDNGPLVYPTVEENR
ncbi:hypothetical protein Tco_0719440, partial [Tanacetum coccineum]